MRAVTYFYRTPSCTADTRCDCRSEISARRSGTWRWRGSGCARRPRSAALPRRRYLEQGLGEASSAVKIGLPVAAKERQCMREVRGARPKTVGLRVRYVAGKKAARDVACRVEDEGMRRVVRAALSNAANRRARRRGQRVVHRVQYFVEESLEFISTGAGRIGAGNRDVRRISRRVSAGPIRIGGHVDADRGTRPRLPNDPRFDRGRAVSEGGKQRHRRRYPMRVRRTMARPPHGTVHRGRALEDFGESRVPECGTRAL